MSLPLVVRLLGVRPYGEVLALQRELHRAVRDEGAPAILLVCSHPPVITVGSQKNASATRVPRDEILRRGVEYFEVERGGDITYHAPSQLIFYPILDLRLIRHDVGWYVRTLEQVVICTLADLGVTARAVAGAPGVWIDSTSSPLPNKIASIGVKLSRWCTFHGVAMQVGAEHDGFSLIRACGFDDLSVTSVTEVLGSEEVYPLEVIPALIEHFCELFDYREIGNTGHDYSDELKEKAE